MNNEVAYICDVCKDELFDLRESKNYCRVSSLESSFVCGECTKIFAMAYEVTDKRSLVNKSKLQPDCSIQSGRVDYEEQSATQQGSERMATDSKERPSKCEICGFLCKSKSALYRHGIIHKGIFKCKICNKCWGSKKELHVHILKHSRLRNKCNKCPKTFKYFKDLRNHMNLHKISNPFRCIMCEKKCVSKRSLRIHMLKHSNERPYKCSMCPKAYKSEKYYLSHMETHKKQNYLHQAKNTEEHLDYEL